ncbi:hypothetical protein HYR54_10380 [Candidatus Acetothermia bacterium]|nr:hypothetical protein [Candidatus Acetothermia bacterium]MBI3459610.1 hypothetical protein [Candidatus Acetothermia bacterium]MBI3659255.1 hypothetical protein [Candidatus Acetothermia bacterium]
MRTTFARCAFLLVVWFGLWGVSSTLAAPTVFQCPLPTIASGGLLNIPTPVALPTSGEFVIQFQRTAGESTQTSINLSEVKQLKDFLDRLAKTINDEAAQRLPKMAAVRERGLDQVIQQQFGNATASAFLEVLRLLLVYDPAEVTVNFQGPRGYSVLCTQMAPIREIPNLTDVKFTSQPILLFAAFPERVNNGDLTTGAIAYTDQEDDTTSIKISYQSEDGSVADAVSLTVQAALVPTLFGPALKAVRFQMTVDCHRRSLGFVATAVARDKVGHESEPLKFSFACER